MFAIVLTRIIKGKKIKSYWCGLENGFGAIHQAIKWDTIDDSVPETMRLVEEWLNGYTDEEDLEIRAQLMFYRYSFRDSIRVEPI